MKRIRNLIKNSFRTLLLISVCMILFAPAAISQTAGQRFEKALYLEEVNGKLQEAIDQYQLILKEFPKNREIIAKSLLHIGICSERLGLSQASENYRAVINKYPDQSSSVTIANERLSRLDSFTSETTLKAEQSFKLAGDLYKGFKYESAVAEYKKVIQLSPKSKLAEEAQLWIGQCYFKQGQYEQALASFKSIKKDYPQSTIVPVTELMIAQTKQAQIDDPKKSPVKWLDDKTILDPRTGIKYTKIATLAGKNDIIDFSEFYTFELAPNRRFAVYGNKIVPFDNSEIIKLSNDSMGIFRLSPDGTRLAMSSSNGIMGFKLSPENGRVLGDAYQIADLGDNSNLYDMAWAPDQKSLLLRRSSGQKDANTAFWTVSTSDGSLKQVKKTSIGRIIGFSRNNQNIVYNNPNCVSITPAEGGKSLTLINLNHPGYIHNFILSPSNDWLIDEGNSPDSLTLYRLADTKKHILPIAPEAGKTIGWAPKGHNILTYKSSYDYSYHLKVVSPLGGPTMEIQKSLDRMCDINSWSNDGKSIIAIGAQPTAAIIYPIDNTPSREFVIPDINEKKMASFSPDYSKILLTVPSINSTVGSLSVAPFSYKDGKVTGPPKEIFNKLNKLAKYTWSPDGTKIAVVTSGELWICPVDEMKPVFLCKTFPYLVYPVWSPDGNMIAIRPRSLPGGKVDIISTVDGAILKRLDSVNNFDWSPDHSKLAVAFNNGQLAIITVSNWEKQILTDWSVEIQFLDIIKWSPDGKFMAFNGYNNDNRGYGHLFVMNSHGGKVTELAAEDFDSKDNVFWSPDSKWIAYDSWGVHKVRPEGTLWEADLSEFMKALKKGVESGINTETDINALAAKILQVKPDGTFIDARDNRKYSYKKIGEQTWMAENLAWLPEVYPDSSTSSDSKRYYVYGFMDTDVTVAKNTENYQKYGVLYNWTAAMNGASSSKVVPSGVQGACPSEWHVPSDAEWMILEKMLGMSEIDLVKDRGALRPSGSVNNKLRSPNGWGDDDIFNGASGFNALPGGLVMRRNSMALTQTAYFWTSTAYNDTSITARLLSRTSSSGIYRNTIGKVLGQSLRCVKNN